MGRKWRKGGWRKRNEGGGKIAAGNNPISDPTTLCTIAKLKYGIWIKRSILSLRNLIKNVKFCEIHENTKKNHRIMTKIFVGIFGFTGDVPLPCLTTVLLKCSPYGWIR
jgi:hypothetical protein